MAPRGSRLVISFLLITTVFLFHGTSSRDCPVVTDCKECLELGCDWTRNLSGSTFCFSGVRPPGEYSLSGDTVWFPDVNGCPEVAAPTETPAPETETQGSSTLYSLFSVSIIINATLSLMIDICITINAAAATGLAYCFRKNIQVWVSQATCCLCRKIRTWCRRRNIPEFVELMEVIQDPNEDVHYRAPNILLAAAREHEYTRQSTSTSHGAQPYVTSFGRVVKRTQLFQS